MAKSRSLKEFASDTHEYFKEKGMEVQRGFGRHAFKNPTGSDQSVEGAELMVDAGGEAARLRKVREEKERKRKE